MEKSVSNQIELQLKIASGCLGVVFVLGILISNLQLLELGLADFSSLRARNIFIGFTFLLYVIFFLIALIVTSGVLVLCFKTATNSETSWKTKILLLIRNFMIGTFIMSFICIFVGCIFGYFLSWGMPWLWGIRDYWSLEGWRFSLSDTYTHLSQFSEIYLHPKSIAAICVAFIPVSSTVIFYLNKKRWFKYFDKTKGNSLLDRFNIMDFKLPSYLLFLLSFSFMLVGYAEEVYPNIRYSLGGGQPAIVKLEIKKENILQKKLLGIDSPKGAKTQVVTTAALALWYRDSDFFYLSPLFHEEKEQNSVVAIDSKIVLAIRYLQGYVKVKSGGQIITSMVNTRKSDLKK